MRSLETRTRQRRRALRVVSSLIATAAAAAATLAGCTTTEDLHRFESAPLHGVVYDGDGAPLGWVAVGVDGTASAYSDINGRFTVPRVTRGAVTVRAEKAGYETVIRELEFLNRTQMLHVRMHSAAQLAEAAEAAMAGQRWDQAVRYATRALVVDPTSSSARFLAAAAQARAGFPEAALETLSARWPNIVRQREVHDDRSREDPSRAAVRLLVQRIRAAASDADTWSEEEP